MPTTPRTAIPYPAVGDPPNLPVQMEAIATSLENQAKDDQGLFANRPVSTLSSPGIPGRYYYATDRKVAYRDYGTGWNPINGIERGTVLPGSAPADYTLFDLVVDDATGIIWTFRYKASEATYKWVFVGGPSKGFSENNDVIRTTSSGSYVALGIGVAVPYRGLYEIELGANIYNNSANNSGGALSFTVPIPGPDDPASDNDGIMSQAKGTGPDTNVLIAHHHLRRILTKTAVEAGTFNIHGKILGGGTAGFRGLSMYVRPIQVMT